jgi:hypothetical protein
MTKENWNELEKLRGARIVDIRDALPTFYFDNKATLFLECPWRLVANSEQIIIGHLEFKGQGTHDEGMIIVKNEILNRKVLDFEMEEKLKDIRITFENNRRLDIFVHSALYESWNLHVGQRNFIATPGGQLAIF